MKVTLHPGASKYTEAEIKTAFYEFLIRKYDRGEMTVNAYADVITATLMRSNRLDEPYYNKAIENVDNGIYTIRR